MKNKYTSLCLLFSFSLLSYCNLSAKNENLNASFPKETPHFTGTQSAPLSFIQNVGQVKDQFGNARGDIQFLLKTGNGLSIFIANGAVHYQFCNTNRSSDSQAQRPLPQRTATGSHAPSSYSMYRMDVALMGANKSATVITEQKQNYYENYFTTATPTGGTSAQSFNKITYKDIYPNIDWVLYTTAGKLKHEFIVHQGGSVNDIKLQYGGTTSLKIDAQGNLMAGTPHGSITEHAPISFQKDGKKVFSRFVLNGTTLQYETGKYTGDLIIDPSLFWATYYGGTSQEYPHNTASDGSGNVYITGNTQSIAAIATSGAHLTTFAGGGNDAYLAKFNSSGVIQWATYYGGDDQDYGYGVATDATGNVYLAGITNSDSVIATTGAFDTTLNGGDAFLVKFNAAGLRLWATYFGGSSYDEAYSVATDASGDVYLCGRTGSASGLATPGAHQTVFAGGTIYICDAFLAKFSSTGTRLWATYLGGNDDDYGFDVATDPSGNVYLAGYTISTSGIATSGAHQTTFAGGPDDAYLAKFSSTGTIQWATYYGGVSNDQAHSVDVDAAGNVYIAGHTGSTSAIATPGAHQPTYGGGLYDGFCVKFNTTGLRQWATYYGGSSLDYLYGIAVQGSGNVFVAGYTQSYTGISTPGYHQPAHGGGLWDGFVAKLNTAGTRQWGSYFGGSSYDYASDVCVDPSGGVFITGYTESLWAIATTGAHQTTNAGSVDAFLAKFDGNYVPPVVGPITGIATLCIGANTTLSHTMAGGTWSSSATAVAVVGFTTGLVTGISAGTATISYNTSAGTATLVVTVSAMPAPITAPAFTVCVGSNITLASATSGGSWSSSSTSTATVGAGSGTVTGVSAATATITYTYSGCSVTKEVTVLALPNPAISGSYTVCEGFSAALSGATPGGTWSSTNPAIGSIDPATGVVSGVSAGTTTIKHIVSNTCGADSATHIITVIASSICLTHVNTTHAQAMMLRIYPNPSHGSFTVNMESVIEEKIDFIVTDIVGKPVKEFSIYTNLPTEINVNQPPGIYFIKTANHSSGYVAKLIIQ